METITRTPPPTSARVDESASRVGLKRWGWRAFVTVTAVTAVIGLFFTASMDPTSGPYSVDER